MRTAAPFVSGKECYPFAVTTADMLYAAQASGFDPDRSAFAIFNGSGPCRFGQYNVAQRMIMDQAGFAHVPLYSPMQDARFYRDLGILGRDFSKRAWKGVAAIDLLIKCLHEHRPYEREPGMADHLYARHPQAVMDALASRDCDVRRVLVLAATGLCQHATPQRTQAAHRHCGRDFRALQPLLQRRPGPAGRSPLAASPGWPRLANGSTMWEPCRDGVRAIARPTGRSPGSGWKSGTKSTSAIATKT